MSIKCRILNHKWRQTYFFDVMNNREMLITIPCLRCDEITHLRVFHMDLFYKLLGLLNVNEKTTKELKERIKEI